MPILRTLTDRALAAIGLVRAAAPGPSRGAAAVPVSSTALTTATVAEVRAWIDAHDQGQFLQSAMLARLATRDADLFGALGQRVLALLGLPVVTEPAIDTAAGRKLAASVSTAWTRVVPRGVQHDLVADAVMLGFGLGQIIWRKGSDGYLEPRLEAWPPEAAEYRPWESRWYVQTTTGPLAITPGDGQWVLYAPRSSAKPWYWGAIRCTAEWYLRDSYAAGDASRHAEVHGIPVWGAYLPSGGRETADGRAFMTSLRGMGRNAVVPLPQGTDKATSYDLKLIEAETDAYKIFEFMLRTSGGRMRLAILGQDLTSQNNQVGTNASSTTGRAVTQDVISADAETLADCLREQVIAPWTRYLAGREDLAPFVYHDARPKADKGKESQALLALAQAVNTFGNAGVPIDSRALLEAQGVPLLAQDVQQAGELFQYHLAYGIVTVNEARARLGLEPIAGGDRPPAPPAPSSGPALKSLRLASGDDAATTPGFIAGQAFCDGLTDAAREAAEDALRPDLEAAGEVIEGAESFDAMLSALPGCLRAMPPDRIALQVERAWILAKLAGSWAVLEDLADDGKARSPSHRKDTAEVPRPDVGRGYEAALAWLRGRVPMPAEEFYALSAAAHHRAFTVSGVTQLQVMQQVQDAITRAVAQGTTLEDFKREVAPALLGQWQGTVAAPSARMETIFRTNVQGAYNAGRVARMRDPSVLAVRPFWMFDAILDGRTTEVCRPLNGVILAADDTFWETHQPPLHFNCRSGIRNLRRSDAERRGITQQVPLDEDGEEIAPASGFGATSEKFIPDLTRYAEELVEAHESRTPPAP